jgi:hypothetical protein
MIHSLQFGFTLKKPETAKNIVPPQDKTVAPSRRAHACLSEQASQPPPFTLRGIEILQKFFLYLPPHELF